MSRLLLTATGAAALGVLSLCILQLRQPDSVETHLPVDAAVLIEEASADSRAATAFSKFPAHTSVSPQLTSLSAAPAPHSATPAFPVPVTTPAIVPLFRGSDEAPASAPVDFDALARPARRFEIYARIPITRGGFTPLPAPAPSVVLDLAPGTREPIALIEDAETRTPAQSAALDSTADAFLDRVEQGAAGDSEEALSITWEQAQEDADSIYRNIFGEAAYQRRLTESAIRALGRPVSAP